jgi:hypothetical protein
MGSAIGAGGGWEEGSELFPPLNRALLGAWEEGGMLPRLLVVLLLLFMALLA